MEKEYNAGTVMKACGCLTYDQVKHFVVQKDILLVLAV